MHYEREDVISARFVFRKACGVFTIPALVVHIEHSRGEGGLSGSFGNSWIIEVTQFGVSLPLWIPHILTQHHV